MFGTKRSLVVGLIVALAALGTVPATPASAASEKPTATEIGVSATEIRIAVVADVDTPLAPGLFKGVVDGVRAGAKYINSKAGGGGIAGRKLVVDFIDSKLNPTTSTNALITACSQDYALVGTAAAFLTNADEAVNCKDQAGATTGLPDLAAFAATVEGCAKTGFPISPPSVVCDTVHQTPQTYHTNKGPFVYLQKQHKNSLHGLMLYGNDSKAGAAIARAVIQGAIAAGIKADQNVGQSTVAPQSAYTPYVQKMKQDGSNFAFAVASPTPMIELMSEAQLQGLTDTDFVWTCASSCYDRAVVAQSAATNGLQVVLGFLPFEEAAQNKTLANFIKYVGPKNAIGYAAYGWESVLAFAQAAKATVAKSGVNGLTRQGLLDGIQTLTAFNAGGMMATTDIAHKIPSPCTLIVQLKGDTWKRVYPPKKGTFDCKPSNSVTFKADFQTG